MLNTLLISENIEKLTWTLFILAIAWIANTFTRQLIRVPKRFESRRAKTITTVASSIVSIVIYLTAIYYIFKVLGVDVTPLLASAGIAGLALGFGARSIVEDLISGAFLLLEDSVSVGDLVQTGGSEGIVNSITFRTITLQDKNGALHIIPNGKVGTVINLSRAKARINIDITFPGNTQIDNLNTVAQKTLDEIKNDKVFGNKILSDSKIKGIEEFLQTGKFIYKVVLITKWHNQWDISRHFRYLLKRNLQKANIELA